jgi:ParB-like chromosome segregation protein Spo0J
MRINSSVKTEIGRSEINLNPYNPKEHSEDAIKLQAKNIRKNGFLGGIVWNSRTHNLIDGHRRVLAMDYINKYDGTKEKEYRLMVEVVDYDEKTELEQLTYMAAGGTKADLTKIGSYLDRIDSTWMTDDDLSYIEELRESTEHADMTDLTDMFIKKRDGEKKGRISKEEKKALQKDRGKRMDDRMNELRRHILIELDSDDALVEFCDAIGIRPEYDLIVKGEDILKLIG